MRCPICEKEEMEQWKVRDIDGKRQYTICCMSCGNNVEGNSFDECINKLTAQKLCKEILKELQNKVNWYAPYDMCNRMGTIMEDDLEEITKKYVNTVFNPIFDNVRVMVNNTDN